MIVEDSRQLSRLSTLTEKEIRTTGTIAIAKFGKMMVTSPKALLHGYDWLDTASHEYVHHVVTRLTRNETPIWLHEGIARWYESRWRGPGGDILSPWSAAMLRDAARSGKLVTFAKEHREATGCSASEAALMAGHTRLRPVLMTASAMFLGLIPMAIGAGEGAEQNAALARAVMGGIGMGTVSTLLFVPLLYPLLRRNPIRPLEDY